MIYSVTLLLAALLVFFIRKPERTAALAAPLWKLPFFKVHYFLAGSIFSLVIPDGFEPAFQSVSGPILIFCLTWVGLFFGCGLDIRYHQRFSRGILLNNIIHPALVFAVFMTAGAAYVQLQGETFSGLAQFYLIALCCVFSLYRRHGIYYRTGNYPTVPALEDLLPIGHVIPVILLGIAAFFWGGSQEFVIFGHSFAGAAPFFLFQTVVAIAAGMVLNMLIAGAPAVVSMTAVLAGMAAMLGGIAYSATFSPLFMGTVAAHFSPTVRSNECACSKRSIPVKMLWKGYSCSCLGHGYHPCSFPVEHGLVSLLEPLSCCS